MPRRGDRPLSDRAAGGKDSGSMMMGAGGGSGMATATERVGGAALLPGHWPRHHDGPGRYYSGLCQCVT
eukprot:680545-Rhodomonas_salina.4